MARLTPGTASTNAAASGDAADAKRRHRLAASEASAPAPFPVKVSSSHSASSRVSFSFAQNVAAAARSAPDFRSSDPTEAFPGARAA